MDPSTSYLMPNYSTLDNTMNSNSSMNQPHQNYFVPLGQSLNPSIIPNTPPFHAQKEDDQKQMEARRCKIARQQRRQILQRLRSTRASKTSEDTIKRPPIYREIQKRIPHVFFTLDGKRFEEILTKKLRNSDVNKLGRIVLPKREVEEKLPTPSKEGIKVVLKDIHSGLEWKVKFKYWINVKARMYVLENTVNIVKHYGLCMGDYLSLYEDESKNMYLYTKKASAQPRLELFPREDLVNHGQQSPQNNDIEILASNEGITTSSLLDQNIAMDNDGDGDGGQHNGLNALYENLENIFDVYWK
ncbi:unnamed protein product [Lathyrus sativus]|nr:unnamed protein product [Lathyrus sativus]